MGAGGAVAAECPCDIYEKGGTPCVAAHSTVRALYSDYDGPLYQVRRTSDGTTMNIDVRSPGGFADAAAQDSFLNGKAGTISKIYDQSPNHNDFVKAPKGGFLHNGGLEADAKAAKIKLNGYPVYGVKTTMSWDNEAGSVGYRNNATKNIATGNDPEGMYMVCGGRYYNEWCCFDYGNAQTDNTADAPAIMETVYFGNSTQWGHGAGNGPWVMADLEWGLFAGGALVNNDNTPIDADYVTGMVKGDSTNRYAIKGGDAQSGALKTMYEGPRPKDYYPMKKEGAIVLGVGGDNSHTGQGIFFEGAMTKGYPSDATEDAVQENIIAAGYGSEITAVRRNLHGGVGLPVVTVRSIGAGSVMFGFTTVPDGRRVHVKILDQRGRFITAIADGTTAGDRFAAVWNAGAVPPGIYVWKCWSGGRLLGCGKILTGK
ncbi:MAG: hypothetical protein JW863_07730 [Chitinispirillaceae bacterium]|nr:hypothetical protein [Chitinispirillaceae bacterium]